jgi:hypothetical protein
MAQDDLVRTMGERDQDDWGRTIGKRKVEQKGAKDAKEGCMTLPREVFVRRADVLGAGLGISTYAFKKAVRLGLLERHVFPGMKYGRYRRDEVVRVFGEKQSK